MDIDETENPFGDGVGNRGVDDDDENIPLISTSSRCGSEDTNYRSYHSRTHGETSFIEGIDEHTPLIRLCHIDKGVLLSLVFFAALLQRRPRLFLQDLRKKDF